MSTATEAKLDHKSLVARAKARLANGAGIPEAQADLMEHVDEASAKAAVSEALRVILVGLDPAGTVKAKRAQGEDDGYRVVLKPYSEIEAKSTTWLWDKRMPEAALSMFVGTEGMGKTAAAVRFVRDLHAR